MRETTDDEPKKPKQLADFDPDNFPNEDPNDIARAINESELPAEAQAGMIEEIEKMGPFFVKAMQRISKLEPKIRLKFRDGLFEFARDLELMLDLGQLDEEHRLKLILIFLQFTDDDDDGEDEKTPEPAPSGDELVPA